MATPFYLEAPQGEEAPKPSFLDRVGTGLGNLWTNAPPEAFFSLAEAMARPGGPFASKLAMGLSGFGRQMGESQKRKGLASAFDSMAAEIPEQMRPIFEAARNDPEMQRSLLGGLVSKMVDPQKSGGPFAGTGFDASAANILVEGQKNPALRSTPEYAIAYSNMTKPVAITDAEGRQMLYRPPMPEGIAPPGAPQLQPPARSPQQPRQFPTPGAPPATTPKPLPMPDGVKPDRPGVFFDPEMHKDTLGDGMLPPTQAPGGGTITVIPGTGKTPTEAQAKSGEFYTRMMGAENTLSDKNSSALYMDDSNALARGIGADFLQGEKAQVYGTAGLEWLSGLLRKDTGATITPQEISTYGAIYLPEYGDKPERLKYKAAARQRAAEALRAGMTPDQILKAERTLAKVPATNTAGDDPLGIR